MQLIDPGMERRITLPMVFQLFMTYGAGSSYAKKNQRYSQLAWGLLVKRRGKGKDKTKRRYVREKARHQ